jgi:hypothetical protein
VAISAVIASDVLTSIHIYHSMLPLMGAHAIRSPILPALPGLSLPAVLERYHRMLATGDPSGVLEQFEGDAVVREPTSEQETHRGKSELRRFFSGLLAIGGVSLERCALTDDDTSCALEYNVTAWGPLLLPHQAGLAVYERARTGLLASVRLYDDVERPASAA